jgi:phytoene synthase
MDNVARYEKMALEASKRTTHVYSTSFSLATRLLGRSVRHAIYGIYGLVRLADEIVDTLHDLDQAARLQELHADTFDALRQEFSLNPILHSFQRAAIRYRIPEDLITAFFDSMRMDLDRRLHSQGSYADYIYGSAEVVGLMCLRVFTGGNEPRYQEAKTYARSLGAAFQKVNFLRDMKEDYYEKGRLYFPDVIRPDRFDLGTKQAIEKDIEDDFKEARKGIPLLPVSARLGVYLAYRYYLTLFRTLRRAQPHALFDQRIRVGNIRKMSLIPVALLGAALLRR